MRTDYFAKATADAKTYRDRLLKIDAAPSVEVVVRFGRNTYPRCTYLEHDGTVTVASIDTGRLLATFEPGEWSTIDQRQDGQILQAHKAHIPTWRECPYCPRRAWFYQTGTDGSHEYQCGSGHLLIIDGEETAF